MQNRTIKSGTLYRSFAVQRSAVNMDKRTVELSFASEAPCERFWGMEILDCSPGSVDLSRMTGGAPLLMEHNREDLVGVCESATAGPDRMCRGTFRFGTSARASEILTDVANGIRSLVSVGYRVKKMVTEKVENGLETLRAVSWQPLEVSIVSVPLDPNVGVGRSASNEENEIEIVPMNIKLDPTATGGGGAAPPAAPPPISHAEARSQAKKELRAYEAEIRAIAKQANLPELGEEAIVKETSVDDFRNQAFLTICKGAKPIQASDNSEVGMSEKEVKRYSIVRAINMLATRRQLDGLELEASNAVAKKLGKRAEGFFIPLDVTEHTKRTGMVEALRALVPNIFSAGGALIETDLQSGSMIELLRNAMQVMALGARHLTGLVGDVAIPKQTGGATAYWLPVGAAVTRSQQTVGQLALTPHRLSAATAYDKQLLIQSSISVEQFVREDLMTVMALEKDRAAINGSGVGGEPLGILGTTALSTPVTFATAASPTFIELIKFETNLAVNNADRGNLGWLVNPSIRGWAKGNPKFASTGMTIWEDDSINGYPVKVSNQVPTATPVIFGRWDDLVVADWDGIDVVVDPYTLSLNAQIGIVINMWTDIGIRHSTSFAVSTN